jgi:hypothetical protein
MVIQDLLREVTALWQTDELRRQKPTPVDGGRGGEAGGGKTEERGEHNHSGLGAGQIAAAGQMEDCRSIGLQLPEPGSSRSSS